MECILDQSGSSAFVSDGHVSLVGRDVKVQVKVLRDNAAFGSYMVNSVLPFSQSSDTGDYILMHGMSLDLVPVPVHKLQLDCGLVQGEVEMGVCPALLIQGVDIILGNNVMRVHSITLVCSLLVLLHGLCAWGKRNIALTRIAQGRV